MTVTQSARRAPLSASRPSTDSVPTPSSARFDDRDLSEDDPDGVLYLVDFENLRAKDTVAQLEHPFYTLGKRVLDRSSVNYEHGGTFVKIEAGPHGLPTIYDKDVIIYILSQAMRQRKECGVAPRKLRLRMRSLLEFTGRGTGGKSYAALEAAIDRLTGVTVRTNITTNGREKKGNWHLMETHTTRAVDDTEGYAAFIDVTLGDWLHGALCAGEVLTLSRDYLNLSKPIDRRLYEIARKHCGHQPEWTINLDLLHLKSGSQGAKVKLKQRLQELARTDGLPDYSVEVLVEERARLNEPQVCRVRFVNRHATSEPPSRPAISPETIESLKKALGLTTDELYDREAAFWEHLQKTGAVVANYDAQFTLFAFEQRPGSVSRVN